MKTNIGFKPEKWLSTLISHSPGRPLITYYGQQGSRIELSAQTLSNWVSKTAYFLHDELEVEAGETIIVDLPPHWLSAAITLGAWSAGITPTPSNLQQDAQVIFGDAPVRHPRFAKQINDYCAVNLHGLEGFNASETGPGVVDFISQVRLAPDNFYMSHSAAVADYIPYAVNYAIAKKWSSTDILGLIVEDSFDQIDSSPYLWLLAPLYVGARIVIFSQISPDMRTSYDHSEQITDYIQLG